MRFYLHISRLALLLVPTLLLLSGPVAAHEIPPALKGKTALTEQAVTPVPTVPTRRRGHELLDRAIAALGGTDIFEAVQTLRRHSTQTLRTDNQDILLDIETTMVFPDRAHLTQDTPLGKIELIKDGDEMRLQTAQGSQPAPEAIKMLIASGIWRDLIYLFAHARQADLEVEHLGQETAEGEPAEVLLITPPSENALAFKLYLHPETLRPLMLRYQTINPGTREMVESYDVLSDYREVQGMTLPFLSISYAEGRQVQETVTTSLEINVPVDESVFQ